MLKLEISITMTGNGSKLQGVGGFCAMWHEHANKLTRAQAQSVNVGNIGTVL